MLLYEVVSISVTALILGGKCSTENGNEDPNQGTNSQKESAVGGHCESATAEVNTSRNRCALHVTLLFGEICNFQYRASEMEQKTHIS